MLFQPHLLQKLSPQYTERLAELADGLILTGGGDGSPAPAVSIAKTAFRFLNASFDPDTDYIYSLSTNSIPVQEDPDILSQMENVVKHIIG